MSTMTCLRVVPAAVASVASRREPQGERRVGPCTRLGRVPPTPRYAPALPRPTRVSSTTASGDVLSDLDAHPQRVQSSPSRASRRATAPARPRRAPRRSSIRSNSNPNPTRFESRPRRRPASPPLLTRPRSHPQPLFLSRVPFPARPRGSVAARASSRDGDVVAGLLAAIQGAVPNARSAPDDDALDLDDDLSVESAQLAARLEEAQRENDELREKVAELTAANEDAVAELLEDAAELAAATARAEDLEDEAEELRALNERLASAAEEVAAMAPRMIPRCAPRANISRRSSARRRRRRRRSRRLRRDPRLTATRFFDACADLRWISPRRRGRSTRPAATPAAELDEARKKVDALTALARRRGDDLLAAEAEAAAAAAEVASLKRQLAAAADASLPRVRELEAMMAEMITAEEAAATEAKVRELEIAMAEMASPEETRRSSRFAECSRLEWLTWSTPKNSTPRRHARTPSKRKRTNFAREGSRALEAEMASMSYDDEGAGSDAKGATAAAVAAFVAAPTTKRRETNTATTAPATGSTRKQAFTRTPGAFKKRTLKFSEVRAKAAPTKGFVRTPGTFTLRRMRFDGAGRARATDAAATVADGERRAFKRTPGAFKKRSLNFRAKAAPFTRDVASAAAAGAAETASSSAPAKKDATHSRSGLFVLRRFDFSAIRAKAAPVKAFKRTPGTFTKRKLVFKDGATVIAVEGAPAAGFSRSGAFKLRRFDFLKSRAAAGSTGSASSDGAGHTRTGNFRMRRFKF